jgi:hypothetical protein
VFIAEAYWDMEWALQQHGFDFCYDKRLYDRLTLANAAAVRMHLGASDDYQRRLIRFIENHDEPRAAAALPEGHGRAAAIAVATLPGATLWHDGQLEGRQVRLPVFLGRRPDEPVDEGLRRFYRRLIAAGSAMRQGNWALLGVQGWPDNPTHHDILAWAWHEDGPHHLVAVNLSGHGSQGRVQLPWPDVLSGPRSSRTTAFSACFRCCCSPWPLCPASWHSAPACGRRWWPRWCRRPCSPP